MANHKIFLVILVLVIMLYLGLEWLPYFFVESKPPREILADDLAMQNRIGIGVVFYFLLLSGLIYIKILLQRKQK